MCAYLAGLKITLAFGDNDLLVGLYIEGGASVRW